MRKGALGGGLCDCAPGCFPKRWGGLLALNQSDQSLKQLGRCDDQAGIGLIASGYRFDHRRYILFIIRNYADVPDNLNQAIGLPLNLPGPWSMFVLAHSVLLPVRRLAVE
ncbi:hypothetical protein [Pseudomonas aeruginosa]|uniref:hypothetical protein n=1 Tax=Pseudomonas aeruginosa TaxID=287 RepID=UPI00222EC5A9|nr:hypothetical protein [Pseudomonas aeruginosa]